MINVVGLLAGKYHAMLRFMDAWNLDVHIVSNDSKIIPFGTVNILYRDQEWLEVLRDIPVL